MSRGCRSSRAVRSATKTVSRWGRSCLLITERVWRTVVGDQFAEATVNHCSSSSPTVVEDATLGPRPTISTIAASSRSASALFTRNVLDR